MDNYLMHHGVKGQRKGIRRYQNNDATRTLTPEGRIHYGVGPARTSKSGSTIKPKKSNTHPNIKKNEDTDGNIPKPVKTALSFGVASIASLGSVGAVTASGVAAPFIETYLLMSAGNSIINKAKEKISPKVDAWFEKQEKQELQKKYEKQCKMDMTHCVNADGSLNDNGKKKFLKDPNAPATAKNLNENGKLVKKEHDKLSHAYASSICDNFIEKFVRDQYGSYDYAEKEKLFEFTDRKDKNSEQIRAGISDMTKSMMGNNDYNKVMDVVRSGGILNVTYGQYYSDKAYDKFMSSYSI